MRYPKSILGRKHLKKADLLRDLDGLLDAIERGAEYTSNWTIRDWYIDTVNGNDENAGTSEAPLKSGEGLVLKLGPGPILLDHPMNVWVAGDLPYLNLNVVQTTRDCAVQVKGWKYTTTSLGTVSTYTDYVHATATASHLQVSGVTDWASLVGARLRVTSGASLGAIAWVARENPHSTGVGVARVSRFATRATTGGCTVAVPAAGVTVVTDMLPRIRLLNLAISTPSPLDTAPRYDRRTFEATNLIIDDFVCDGASNANSNTIVLDGCKVGMVMGGFTFVSPRVFRSWFCGSGEPNPTISFVGFQYCLFKGGVGGVIGTSGAIFQQCQLLGQCLFQGVRCQLAMGTTLNDCQIFDVPSGDAFFITSAPRMASAYNCSGRDNVGYGYRCQGNSTLQYSSAALNVTGTLGEVYLNRTAVAIPWSARPWNDGARSGTATLVAGTVTVTVPYVLSSQRMLVSRRTAGGTLGDLRIVYASATTITITSSSNTDTSEVTWSILPTGNNEVFLQV